jgi:cytochrome c oxidase subunit 2
MRDEAPPSSRRTADCDGYFLKKNFPQGVFPIWMIGVSLIRFYISGFPKKFIPFATATLLLFIAGTASSAAEPQATQTPEIHRIADIFQPLSRSAELLLEPTHLVLLICLGIFLVVMGVLVYVLIKFRPRGPEDHLEEPPQVYGSYNIEMAWTVIPCLIVFVLVLVSARSIVEIQDQPMPEDALQIRLIGHQWWWEIQYPELGIITANEIHVPVSSKDGKPRPTHIILESADVIHSFWVPQLAGKTDLVPNRVNHTWIEPFKTGVFLGNCAEYCGTQHANMLLRVIVQTPEDFQKWVENQKQLPSEPKDVIAIQGKKDFYDLSCVSCHKIDSTPAEGVFGPDLTKFAIRQTLGAGVAANTPENLHAWLFQPDSLKPGCYMPDMKLSPQQLDSLVAYLQTLK